MNATNKTDKVTYKFSTSTAAWDFMRACDTAGVKAGFPGLRDHTVQVAVATWVDRERADKLAGSAEVVDYKFGD